MRDVICMILNGVFIDFNTHFFQNVLLELVTAFVCKTVCTSLGNYLILNIAAS